MSSGFKISLSLVLSNLIMICFGVFSSCFRNIYLLGSLGLQFLSNLGPIFLRFFFLLPSLFFRDYNYMHMRFPEVVYSTLIIFPYFALYSFFCVLCWIFSISMTLNSLIFYSAMSNLPLISSSIFFISDIIVFNSRNLSLLKKYLSFFYMIFWISEIQL